MKLSFVLLVGSVLTMSAGFGWWVHSPGAGLVVLGAAGAVGALLRDDGSSE